MSLLKSINPYYNPAKLDLEMISFEESLSYEFDIICFWANKKGEVFTVCDAGCSCPTPFEGYEGETQEECTKQLDQIFTLEEAIVAFDKWNNSGYNGPRVSITEKQTLRNWIESHLQPKSN